MAVIEKERQLPTSKLTQGAIALGLLEKGKVIRGQLVWGNCPRSLIVQGDSPWEMVLDPNFTNIFNLYSNNKHIFNQVCPC